MPSLPIRWLAAALALPCALALAQPADDGKYEQLHTKAGRSFPGVVLADTPAGPLFQIVQRQPGRPAVLVQALLPQAQLQRLDRLAGKERDDLLARVAALDPTGKVDDPRFGSIELGPAVFQHADPKKGLSYTSEYFELLSNANEDVVRRAAVRLEQIHAAYTFYLPPAGRAANTNTLTVYLYQTLAAYHGHLARQGRDIFSLAYFDTSSNEIICGAELGKLGQRLAELRLHHQALAEQIVRQEVEIKKLPKGEVQERAGKLLADARQELALTATKNEVLFAQATRQLFRSIYHEAFHAYLANFVFPPARGEVPRWLNEGLAQVFEEAVIEKGVLRVGPTPPPRLEQAQALARAGQLVKVTDLVKAPGSAFVVGHGLERQTADRHYLTSWALAHYLMFDRGVVGSSAIEQYLTAINGKADPRTGTRQRGDPIEAATKLLGQPLAQVEKDLQQYVLELKPDGTRGK